MDSEKTDGQKLYEQAREQDPSRPDWDNLSHQIKDQWERVARGPERTPIQRIIERFERQN